ncbi:hypothetical protein COCCADRAFT_37284 [Bipolaris zeicola 26-R-13]|uniref:Uncharacterized protein n=1 Tax=Cochliobolus carbonum (strain 26-R-13) TaxID=930089 RepID=W6Y4N9_COCC2|nr:uncharacterized protein COCCADRAFT_37284 [Bipolaris zeicola 26-R-13]EUC32853.1 hypothetical protein COCCADRAFT_37284 [Bipolaris zeicola 26-R-13]
MASKHGSTSYSLPLRLHVPWLRKHSRFLISNGLHRIVITGTNGGKLTLGVVGYTRDSICQTMEAKEPSTPYRLALVSPYLGFAMRQYDIVTYLQDLTGGSSIPLVAGLEINLEMLDLLCRYKNIVAIKLMCDSLAKVGRISASLKTKNPSSLLQQVRVTGPIPALNVGGVGTLVDVATRIKLCVTEWEFAKGELNGTEFDVAQKRVQPKSSADCRNSYPPYTDAGKKKHEKEKEE